MPETFSCTFVDCDKVFSKAYELRKHKATHDNPSSVFHCPNCDFITLQKKNLGIHFATHTGEKNIQCPETTTVGDREQRCDYRTHDPAALSKHRKKVHGYVPVPNRSRPKAAPVSSRKTLQNKDENVPRRRRRSQRVTASPRRRVSRSPRKARNAKGGPGRSSTLATSFLPLDDVDENVMDVDGYEDLVYDSNNATLVGSDDEMRLDLLFDPSLRSQWMARYEMGYSTFDKTGMRYEPEPLPEISPLDLVSLDVKTGREGCLCPEWMVEVGIEGWNQSVLEAHKEYYVIDA